MQKKKPFEKSHLKRAWIIVLLSVADPETLAKGWGRYFRDRVSRKRGVFSGVVAVSTYTAQAGSNTLVLSVAYWFTISRS